MNALQLIFNLNKAYSPPQTKNFLQGSVAHHFLRLAQKRPRRAGTALRIRINRQTCFRTNIEWMSYIRYLLLCLFMMTFEFL